MKLLVELLALEAEKGDDGILSGAEKLVAQAKKGFDKAKQKHKERENDLKQAETAAKQAKDEAEKKIKDAKKRADDAKKYAEKEAKEAAASAEEEHKLKSAESMAALKDDLDDFVDAFFTTFPFKDEEAVEKIMEKYPTLEAAKEAFLAFKGFSTRIEELRKGFNSSLVKRKKLSAEAVRKHAAAARMYADGEKNFDADFISFVKREAKFFKNLVRVTDDFKLDDEQFKELMALKMNQTDPARIGDAARYLNILFVYASARFLKHAQVIGVVGKNLLDSKQAADREARNRARAAKAAALPPEET